MAEFLETTVDKFTFRVATDRLYTEDGLWVLPMQSQGRFRVRVGVTDFLQQHSGDVAFVHVKPEGTALKASGEFAALETMKVDVSLTSPVAGAVVEVNQVLKSAPEVVNQDPYGRGWLAAIEAADWQADSAKLLDAPAYLKVMQAQAEQELKS
ncbi:MAG: glycine cleavage system protein H [Candidatus Binatus sp.]|uniref:glycine cleavage system protein H n=1 Tax=Candidatus Binatus sp. TaxID=2811406 RepID=UPI003C7444CF